MLLFIFAVLFLPMVQKALPFIKSKGLNGEFTIAPDTVFIVNKWFDGAYWNKKNQYINDNMGLRPDLIRLTDEIDYDLFKKIHSEWRLIGDNSCVFQDVFIYSYLGRDYNGYPYIHEKVRKMKAIQDTLAKLGKSLIFVQSPCKAFYYPEYFPREYKEAPRKTTNYEVYKRLADSMGLTQVDFNAWFLAMKSKSTELLFPKQGFHWSMYGSMLAADSFTNYIEKLRGTRMVHPYWNEVIHTNIPRGTDNDIAKSMNLIFPLANETFTYPDVQYREDKSAVKPNVIYIGDSFLFQWMDEGFMDHADSNWQIWYYYMTLVNKDIPEKARHFLDDQYCMDQLNKADCIVIMYTSRNLDKLARDFVEKTYDHFYPSNNSTGK